MLHSWLWGDWATDCDCVESQRQTQSGKVRETDGERGREGERSCSSNCSRQRQTLKQKRFKKWFKDRFLYRTWNECNQQKQKIKKPRLKTKFSNKKVYRTRDKKHQAQQSNRKRKFNVTELKQISLEIQECIQNHISFGLSENENVSHICFALTKYNNPFWKQILSVSVSPLLSVFFLWNEYWNYFMLANDCTNDLEKA